MAHSLLPRSTLGTTPATRLNLQAIFASHNAASLILSGPPKSITAVTPSLRWSSNGSFVSPKSETRAQRSRSRRNAASAPFQVQTRSLSSTACARELSVKSHPPKSRDRGPASKEDTQTDFGAMNMLGNMAPPSTAVDACLDDGFALDSGLRVTGAGVLLVGGEAFKWRPWIREGRKEGTIGAGAVGNDNKGVGSAAGKLKNAKGMFEVDKNVWGVLDLVWPKPDLLILGTGEKIVPVSPQTRRDIAELGIRIEVQDTRNAAAQFNMLATERGTQQVAAALVPVGWREGK
ncbi:hypothetical protein Slin15195_G025250 [Septoria linicola]|uniref:NADH dehydrogenase [ubiquinone] 1 alpha subcomplex assembly factor 3 n=1 Tax=Septoria linicola TaxID=215465 RepID=A0A9Q9ANI2_9PEZI|nr:hypothetical protein Slin14017_G024330 [Septoria linicola]USW49206.1 hypothetical protein Slin15195_G025250 [Septoria linicola]